MATSVEPGKLPIKTADDPESFGIEPNKTFARIESTLPITRLDYHYDSQKPKEEGHLRLVCISDTHTETEELVVPAGDVLIHTGDFTRTGTMEEVQEFANFLAKLDFKWKIVIAGNHDIIFDRKEYPHLWKRFGHSQMEDQEKARELLMNQPNVIYLENSSANIMGINFYGSPYSPEYYFWGFQLPRKAMQHIWNNIPENTDILLTHGPPLGYNDLTTRNKRAGCYDLLLAVQRIKPKYHIFGHIHEGYGMTTNGVTTFVNSATCTRDYSPTQPPIVFDYPIPK